MSGAVLEIRGVSKDFDPGGRVLDEMTLSVEAGEILYLLGPSGSGKTTLMRLICGFETPDAGEIAQEGKLISQPGWVLPPERRHIGMVFQDYAIFPHLTVRENVAFGLSHPFYQRAIAKLQRMLGGGRAEEPRLSPEAVGQRLAELFKLTGLTGLEQRYPHELSGGQQQRVALARALAPRPGLILLDEPFSNLDTALRRRIRVEVRDVLRRSGATSILVTHDQEEAINMADRIALIRKGRLEQLGTPDELLHAPASRFVATFVGMSDFIRGQVKGGEVETELGRYPLPAKARVPGSGEVDVLLRPDHLQLVPRGSGTRARVEGLEFQGIQSLYTLSLPSGAPIQAFFPGHPHLTPGDTIHISFDPPRLILFPAE